jgi:DNA polymerase-3 subunit gamma/tau
MALQALYRKWRPQTFEQVVGQDHIVHTLRNALTSDRIHHAYLFTGPRGTGKTTTARLLAKAVNCLASEDQRPCNTCAICQAVNDGRLLDLIEIDAASNSSVDDVRLLRERIGFRPSEARYRVYVIDEAHMLSNAAFNALLKTLEEPPPHAIFVLATTRADKILDTVLSRCQRFDFRRIPLNVIVDRLAWIVEQEGIEVDEEVLALIGRQAKGCMRDAESLLDQLASSAADGLTVGDARAALGISASATVLQVTDALASGDVAEGLNAINSAVEEGADLRQFARQIVEHLRALLLVRLKSGVDLVYVSEEERPRLEAQAAALSPWALARAVRLFNRPATQALNDWQPQLPLEMAFIEAVLPAEEGHPPAHPPEPAVVLALSPSPRPSSTSRPSSSPAPTRTPSRSAPPSRGQGVQEPASTYSAPASEGSSESDSGMSSVWSEVTPETLRSRWPEFLSALRPRSLPLEALMRSCEPVAVEGDVITMGFVHDFHRSKLEEEQNKRDVEDVLSDLLGQRYRVRCTVSRQAHSAGVSGQAAPIVPQPSARSATPTPAGSETAQPVEQVVQQAVEQILAEDPVVRAAVEDLGAQIVPRHEGTGRLH